MTERDLDLDSVTESAVLDYIRMVADVGSDAGRGRPDWVYQSSYQLLLEHGRFFNPAPRMPGIGKMPDRLCYENATATAHANRGHRLIYAEGFATPSIATDLPLEHAWCVTPDGTVVDPTWPSEGAVYFGVAFADSATWPTGARGLLSNFDQCMPLLRHGLPTEASAEVGRPPVDRT